MTKECVACKQQLPLSNFNKKQGKCKQCQAAYNKKYKEDNWIDLLDKNHNRQMMYKTNIVSFARRMYKNMLNRVHGYGSVYSSNYQGLPICTRDEFMIFCANDKNLPRLYKAWQDSGHKIELVPSPDRLIPEVGYVIGNIEICTFSENVKRQFKKDPNNTIPSLYGLQEEEN